ncbi:MAG: threonine ammonia-lyase [Deltaproteobacteria bacterium]|nr:threonine ammonia-lyase [Deltaproteobacteria bacterium]
MITFEDIEAARERIRDTVYLSPCAYSETISRMTGNTVFFKLENLQMTGSFKERGALNRLLVLSKAEAKRGVIAASAGNHGMALAFHSQRLGIPSTIVMPVLAPLIKVTSVRRYGGRTRLYGSDYDAAFDEAHRLSSQEGLIFIHPFNDPWVVSGQGTLGLELHEQAPELDAVIVPVGGGGLIAGIALALKKLQPSIRIIGVQAEQAPAMRAALDKGKVVHLPPAATIADGIAIRAVGEIPLELVQKHVDEIVTVNEGEIANAVMLLLEIEKTVAEGAAAVPLAALVNRKIALKGKRVALIVSGGNIDVNLISRIIEKGLIQDGRLARLSVVIPDRPGYLSRLSQRIAQEGINILHIQHVRGFGEIAVGETEVEMIIETTGQDHIRRIIEILKGDGYRTSVAHQV